MTRAELLARLAELKPWLQEQGIVRVRLFGSYARDEAGPDSDVDLLVELSRPMGLEFFSIEEKLGERLGARVEMTTWDGLPRDIKLSAGRDLVDA